jgi:hypothetical protein
MVVASLAGCAGGAEVKPGQPEVLPRVGTPIQDVKGTPEWVIKKGRAFSGDKRSFYGVGNAAGLINPSLMRRTAEANARRDLAQTLEVYQAALLKVYEGQVTAGAMDKQFNEQDVRDTFKQLTDKTLVGTEIIEYWEHPQRNEAYALARLETERFVEIAKAYQGALAKSRELDAQVREFVRRNADRAYDELNQELSKKNQGGGLAQPSGQRPSSNAPRGRAFLVAGDFLPVANGEVQVGSPVEAGVVEAGDLVEIAYEDLVAVAGDHDVAHLAAEAVEIGAGELVEVAYEDLVAIAEAQEIAAGSVEFIDVAKKRPSGGSSGSSARSSSGGGGNRTYYFTPKQQRQIRQELRGARDYPNALRSQPKPKFQLQRRCPPGSKTAVCGVRG